MFEAPKVRGYLARANGPGGEVTTPSRNAGRSKPEPDLTISAYFAALRLGSYAIDSRAVGPG